MAVTVNSHQHFWSLADPFFCWPTPDLGSIYRDFGPNELRPHLEAADVSCTVLVQVAPVTAETDRLLDIASGTDFVGASLAGSISREMDVSKNWNASLQSVNSSVSDPCYSRSRTLAGCSSRTCRQASMPLTS